MILNINKVPIFHSGTTWSFSQFRGMESDNCKNYKSLLCKYSEQIASEYTNAPYQIRKIRKKKAQEQKFLNRIKNTKQEKLTSWQTYSFSISKCCFSYCPFEARTHLLQKIKPCEVFLQLSGKFSSKHSLSQTASVTVW